MNQQVDAYELAGRTAALARLPKPPEGERRQDWIRVPFRWHGRYRKVAADEPGWQQCATLDLSAGGAALECRGAHLEVGDVVLIRFDDLPRYGFEAMQLRAEVRNSRRDGRTYGLQWTRLTDRQQEQLIHFVLTFERVLRRRVRYAETFRNGLGDGPA